MRIPSLLGDTCRFKYSIDFKKAIASQNYNIKSGTVLAIKINPDLLYHSVDKVLLGSSTLLCRSLGVDRLNVMFKIVVNSY